MSIKVFLLAAGLRPLPRDLVDVLSSAVFHVALANRHAVALGRQPFATRRHRRRRPSLPRDAIAAQVAWPAEPRRRDTIIAAPLPGRSLRIASSRPMVRSPRRRKLAGWPRHRETSKGGPQEIQLHLNSVHSSCLIYSCLF